MKIVPTACAVLPSLFAAASTAAFSTAAEPVRIGDLSIERAGPVTVPVTVGRAGAMGPE